MPDQTCLVIGAGISGLLAAGALQENGWQVTVIDKARGVGGRMASRRFERAVFDHGAQFFTVRDARFAALVAEWEQAGVVDMWSRGFATLDSLSNPSGHPRYRGLPSMTAVPKLLAADLDVRLETHVITVETDGARWTVQSTNGEHFTAGALVITSPVPQSLVLMSHLLPAAAYATLSNISYHSCFTVMAILDDFSRLPEPGALQIRGEPIAWIGDNGAKGVSLVPAVTIHTGPQFSRAHLEDDWETVAHLVMDAAAEWVGAKVRSYQVHRWLYSHPVQTYLKDRCFMLPGSVVFAGDAFGRPNVEGAALSGLAAAAALIG